MGRNLSQLWQDQSGQGMAEYGLLTALVPLQHGCREDSGREPDRNLRK